MKLSGPIFIAGLERTGTSLLYALLASHPSIAMTRRTNWWTFFYDRYGDLGHDDNLDRILTDMRRYRRHRKLELDFDRLRQDFVTGDRSYCRLFALMQGQHAERTGRPRWGDKSLHTERYAERVYGCFPEARIIHIIRDPRDRYASVLKRWRSKRGGVGSATAAWLASVELAAANRERYPDRYRVLEYEALVRDPELTMRSICDFIGEPYDPAMLGMTGASEFRETGGNSSYGKFAAGEISPRSVGRFRSVLSDRQVAFVQRTAGPTMAQHGYEPVPLQMSAGDRLQYGALTVPANAAKMALWRLRERFYDVTGRAPPTDTLLDDKR
jgi:hypothetical protein